MKDQEVLFHMTFGLVVCPVQSLDWLMLIEENSPFAGNTEAQVK